MAKLLNKEGLLYLIKKLKSIFIKNGEILIIAPTIHHISSNGKQVVLNDIEPNQYWIIDNPVVDITINSLIKKEQITKGKKNVIYIQFKSGEYINMNFKDTIMWENGAGMKSNANCLYRIELIDGMGYWFGKCIQFDEK